MESFTLGLLVGAVHITIHEAGHIAASRMVGAKFHGAGWRGGWLGHPYVLLERASTPARAAFVALGGLIANGLTVAFMLLFHVHGILTPIMLNCFMMFNWKASDLHRFGVEVQQMQWPALSVFGRARTQGHVASLKNLDPEGMRFTKSDGLA